MTKSALGSRSTLERFKAFRGGVHVSLKQFEKLMIFRRLRNSWAIIQIL